MHRLQQLHPDSADRQIVEYYCRVLLDPFHLLQRYSKRLGSSVDPIARICMVMLRDALFVNDPEDEETVRRYLRQERGMSDDQIKKVGHTFFVRRCRRAIPPPQQLAARLQAVFDIFHGSKMSNGKPLYRERQAQQSSFEEEHRAIMRHVLSGCVSDHPNVPLYCRLKPAAAYVAAGLERHLCFRGTSQLEGFHRHLLTAVKTWNLSPEMMDAVILEFVTSWNNTAQVRNKGEADIGHTDFALMDDIAKKERAVWGEDHTLFPGYKETLQVRKCYVDPYLS